MNTRDRLMSRASVAVMAAFAPKPEGAAADTSKVGQAENVDDGAGDADGGDELGLSAEEQAQFDAMQDHDSGIAPAADREAAPADGGADGADADADGEGDVEADIVAGAATDAGPDGTPADGARRPPKTISYGRHQRDLQALQEKLDGAVAETAKEREARVRLDERTKQLLEAIQSRPAPAAPDAAAAAAAADPEPDKEVDPIGHLEWRNRKLEKTVAELSSGRQQEQQQTAEQREEANIYRVYEADLTREAQADPAFADAFVHLRETRYRELGFIYADIDITDPAQCALLSPEDQVKLSDNIQRSFHNEQMMVARQALQSKKSPAKVVANLARARGFVPKAPAPANGAAKPANGAAPAVPAARAVAPAAAGSVTDQLQAIRDGQEASRSLSDAGGSPGGTITPERVANMSDDEFTALYEQISKDRFDRQVMGKPS